MKLLVRIALGILGLFIFAGVMGAIFGEEVEPDLDAGEDQVEVVATEVLPHSDSVPVKSQEQLLSEASISTFAVKSNRDVPKITSSRIHTVDDGSVVAEVEFAISERSFMSLIAKTARKDVADLLKSVHEAGIDYDTVAILGSYSMNDSYGNVNERIVVRVIYPRETLNKINWDGFDSEKVYEIAEAQIIHQQFR